IGGEEFFSYLNIGDSLKRTGGTEWKKWHSDIADKILKLQNSDGTWAGKHCITGSVAVTSAANLNLTKDRANLTAHISLERGCPGGLFPPRRDGTAPASNSVSLCSAE